MVWYFFRRLIFSVRAGALVRRIAWLSLISITVSTSAFLIVIFVMGGMNESIQKRILALEPHLTISQKKTDKRYPLESLPAISEIKKNHSEVRSSSFESQDVILRTLDGKFRGAVARGMNKESFEDFIEQLNKLDQGNKNRINAVELWNASEVPGVGEIVMGIDLARSLELLEGEFITVIPPEGLILPPGEAPSFEKVRIKKIISTSIADVDAQFIFYQRLAALNNFSKSGSRRTGIQYWLPDGHNAENFKEEIIASLDEKQKNELSIETWQERNGALFYALKLEKLVIGIFLGLAGLVAGTSILTVLALLMSQKKRDIALLMTLGMSKLRTSQLFTKMGLCLSGTGLGLGLLIGTSVSYYIQEFPINILPQIYYDSHIPARVDLFVLFGVMMVGGVIAFLGSWVPARTVLKIEPSQVLRQKN
ncbi:MAG: FtsX-like permease family protein [Bdellovibrionota bacterium]